jgi:hypothetical protein
MVGLSNIVLCRITAPAHALGGWRVASLGSSGEFGGVLWVVLASFNAEFACAVAWPAAVESESAGVVFFVGSGVRAGHDTVKSAPKSTLGYRPAGEDPRPI